MDARKRIWPFELREIDLELVLRRPIETTPRHRYFRKRIPAGVENALYARCRRLKGRGPSLGANRELLLAEREARVCSVAAPSR